MYNTMAQPSVGHTQFYSVCLGPYRHVVSGTSDYAFVSGHAPTTDNPSGERKFVIFFARLCIIGSLLGARVSLVSGGSVAKRTFWTSRQKLHHELIDIVHYALIPPAPPTLDMSFRRGDTNKTPDSQPRSPSSRKSDSSCGNSATSSDGHRRLYRLGHNSKAPRRVRSSRAVTRQRTHGESIHGGS